MKFPRLFRAQKGKLDIGRTLLALTLLKMQPESWRR